MITQMRSDVPQLVHDAYAS